MSIRFAVPIKALLIVSALALSACRNPDRFSDGTGGANGANGAGGLGNGGVSTTGLGDPSNPASVAYFNQSVGDRVLFVVDQWTLTDVARSTLSGQAAWLKANPEYAIIMEGHADEQGTREYNLNLSAKRASSAKNYLVSQGIPASRIQTVAYGKEKPIALCSDESCYAQNRRAVTVLSMGSGT
jgi:peptidoglycan-associated lipoprotein